MQNPGQVTGVAVPVPGGTFQIPVPTGPQRPLTQQEIQVIRQRRSEMSDQLTSAQGRRNDILQELRTAPAGTEQGLRDQYQVLSDRIVAIERDIEQSGATLRTGLVPAGTIIIPPGSFSRRQNNSRDAERGAAAGAFMLVVLGVFYGIRSFRRRDRRQDTRARYSAENDARMERLEQAVDAIALEIERVGEAQRFQQKLLAESNLMPAQPVGQRSAEPVRAYDERR